MKSAVLLAAASAALLPLGASLAQEPVRAGPSAFGDFTTDAPGVWRHITVSDLPKPFATESSRNQPKLDKRVGDETPKTLPGFKVSLFASGFQGTRRLRTAPNGDVFMAESNAGRITILRAAPGSNTVEQTSVFAEGLSQPFGIAFYPARDPQWVYVGNTDSVVRFPYHSGDLKASGPAEVVVAKLPAGGGHWTRDLAFSPDGSKLYIAVGSGSNIAETMPKKTVTEAKAWDAEYGKGAAWGGETHRADVLVADPDGKNLKVFATGIRNCSGLSVNRQTGDLWCTTNERDLLGDNLVPDYSTRVKAGQFFGWPWYYLGSNEDPRLAGQRPDLKDEVTVPDVLYQPHSAPLQLMFYAASDGPAAFPKAYDGDGFVALHGSWNRSQRTGYKVVRLRLKNGVPTGEYEDFLVGFVHANSDVWGRPVGLAEMKDGSLLVSDDGGNVVWRVAHEGKQVAALAR
jgi:glucose/arabinose dehydrogenase